MPQKISHFLVLALITQGQIYQNKLKNDMCENLVAKKYKAFRLSNSLN